MKIKELRVFNFGSCREVSLTLDSMHALVGANNAGKSTILRALDFFFNPSAPKVTEDVFWNSDTSREIRVEAHFHELSPREIETLGPYLRPDRTFIMARSATLDGAGTDADASKAKISQHYCALVPKLEWLRESEINGANIARWWANRENLVVGDQCFVEFLGGASRPTVTVWKEKAAEFTDHYLGEEDFEDTWIENPTGYAGVLKSILPQFILIPAVRDLADEAKVTKTNPFGKLLSTIVENVTADERAELEGYLNQLGARLNRSDDGKRIPAIGRMERRLTELLKDYMDSELEIEFEAPTIEVLMTTPRLYADDGFRSPAENKGHGLQRAIIFSILRAYSELVTGVGAERQRSLVLGVEEPETYMHPQAQRTLRRVFTTISENGDQIIFSTHSPLLLDVAYFDEIIRVEACHEDINGARQCYTRVWQISMESMIADLRARHPRVNPSPESIRELYMNAYHPNRSEGFFARRIILVEGPTEHYSLPIYADALGYSLDMLNISVVDCGGKSSMDRLYRVFNELGIPCYLLFDYDRNSTDAEIVTKSRELLNLVGLNTEPPDEVMVTQVAACFPNTWEADLADEIPTLARLTSEARNKMGKVGKPLIARYVANALVSQQPAVVPKSIKRIIEHAVDVQWEKSCLQALPAQGIELPVGA